MTLHLTIRVPNWLDFIFAFPLLTFRRFRFGYPFRRIRLTDPSGGLSSVALAKEEAQAKSGGKFTIVDPADFYRLNSFYWLACGKNANLYAARLIRTPTGRLNTILMHRQIFFTLSKRSASNGLVDHRNTDSLDNRKANLRLATHSQNSCNSRRDKSNTYSRYRGVSFSKRKQKWFAAIRANGRKLWLGYFDSELAAARAYDEAAKKYHGEYATLNFKEDI
ncbi:MAG: AP2 domain-containing protein [Sedimentisphaerales bacterium]|jgi:hypothetical protein